jgi:hypothetical protein
MEPVYFIPIGTFIFSIIFSVIIFRHWSKRRNALYLFWWMIGIFTFGAGTLTETINTLTGFHEWNFRLWYVIGALLGGAPLAQGSVYLLMKRKTAHILTAFFLLAFTIAAVLAFTLPVQYPSSPSIRLSDYHLQSAPLLILTILINTYALIFLVGGAIYSAWKYYRKGQANSRFRGNVLIAVGAFLPGIGGTFTHFGHVEVLYATEFVGLILIFLGYKIIRNDRAPSLHMAQQTFEANQIST